MPTVKEPDRKPEDVPEIRINVFVPADLHRRLKATLALQGKSLRQWVIESAEQTVESRPSTAIPSRRQ